VKVYPAIELLGGKAVCLHNGKREQATVYSDDPLSVVANLLAAGAERLHIVDLDGVFSGQAAHRELIAEMVKASSVPIVVGGGIRDLAALESVFGLGVQFAVIGTAAIKNRRFVRKACHDFPGRIIVAIDADADGQVSVEGWTESGGVSALELAARVSVWGSAGLVYTDIAREGLGPNVQATAALMCAVDIPVTAAGGVNSIEDIQELALADVDSVIVGNAIHEGQFTLAQAIAAGRDSASG
jgi:phosphoribosylformimino-5-aminoimidazole carboxamide ribotide isomerase